MPSPRPDPIDYEPAIPTALDRGNRTQAVVRVWKAASVLLFLLMVTAVLGGWRWSAYLIAAGMLLYLAGLFLLLAAFLFWPSLLGMGDDSDDGFGTS